MEKDCSSHTDAKGSLYPRSQERGLISPFEPTIDKDDLASFLSELSLALSTLIERKLEEYNYEEITLNHNHLKDVKNQ